MSAHAQTNIRASDIVEVGAISCQSCEANRSVGFLFAGVLFFAVNVNSPVAKTAATVMSVLYVHEERPTVLEC